MNVIGFAGKAGAGKDTSAEFLSEFGFQRIAFADPLKRIARDVFGFSREQLWGPSAMRNSPDRRYPRKHTWGVWEAGRPRECACCGTRSSEDTCYLTPRYALQTLGTQWGRDCYELIWISKGLATAWEVIDGQRGYTPWDGITSKAASVEGVAFTDVRFENEITHLKAEGVRVYLIDRPGAGLSGAAGKHESEQAIPHSLVDGVIDNSAGLTELREKVERIGREILAGRF